MIKYFSIFIILFTISSCTPEQVEKVQEQFVLSAMTDGQWKVSSYMKGSTNMSTDFLPYAFQFKNNLTVDAIKNGSVETTGTWMGDPNINAPKITSNFTTGTTVMLLNGTWLITKNTMSHVEASQTVGGEVRLLVLDKI